MARNAFSVASARASTLEQTKRVNAGYEFDVQRTRDGLFVVFHDDPSLRRDGKAPMARMTNFAKIFPGKAPESCIGDLTWEELQALTVSSPQGNSKIPLLREVLENVSPGAFLDIEIKRMDVTERSDGIEEPLLAVLQRCMQDRNPCCISSFDHGFLDRFAALTRQRNVAQRYPVGLISWAKDRANLAALFDRLSPRYLALQDHPDVSEDVTRAQARGIRVLVWQNPQISTAEHIERILATGADGVISNQPNLLNTMPLSILERFVRF